MTKVQRKPKPQAPRPSSVTNVESVFHLGSRFSHWTLELGISLGFGPWDLDFVRRFVAWSMKLSLPKSPDPAIARSSFWPWMFSIREELLASGFPYQPNAQNAFKG
jgi:hypothetical protein